jgi:hypothetical protein
VGVRLRGSESARLDFAGAVSGSAVAQDDHRGGEQCGALALLKLYHGGVPGLVPGDRLLPPSVTGARSCAHYDSEHCRADRVYLTMDPGEAARGVQKLSQRLQFRGFVKSQVRFACESGDRSARDRFRRQARAGDV